MNKKKSKYAGKTVQFAYGNVSGSMVVEDYWHHVSGYSWMDSAAIAAANYAKRVYRDGLPIDDEVVYGKVGALGYLIHVTEIKDVDDE